jgi:hypothetical protein
MVVVESSGTGLVIERTPEGIQARVTHPQYDPRPTLFRYVAKRLPREEGARFHFTTFSRMPAELFRDLLEYPVRMLPLPYRAVTPLRNRAGARPIMISILGHQRLAKGYDRLPEIVEQLLRRHTDIRLFVQNVEPQGPPETHQALRELAAHDDRMMLEETPAGRVRWPQLLEMADLILCPHRPEYYTGYSAIAAEALANGIPLVFPAGTPMEAMLAECGGGGVAFDRFEPASIMAATGEALDRFDHFATLAHAAARRWPETRGPARVVDALMSLNTSSPEPAAGASGRPGAATRWSEWRDLRDRP